MPCDSRVVSWVTCAALVMSLVGCSEDTTEPGGEGLDAAPAQDMSPTGAEESYTSVPVISGDPITCETEYFGGIEIIM